MVALVLVSLVMVIVGFGAFIFFLLRWNDIRYNRKGLPPGTMGWPVFGETLMFLKEGPNFMKNKKTRYGNVFKSHILGSPTIISMDPELNRYIHLNENKGLVPGYPQSMLDILGKYNIALALDLAHKSMRGALLFLINPAMIKGQLLAKTDEFMSSYLSNWDGRIIDIQHKTEEMILLSSLNKIVAGIESTSTAEAFNNEFYKFILGTLSMPINLPGTNYHCAFKARKNIINIFRGIIEERRASQSRKNDDMLDQLLSLEESREAFNEEVLIDQIITIINSGYETMSTTSMMAVKYLHDHPKALQELREEQLAIRKGKGSSDPIDWDDYKSMKFTRAIIFETLRLASVVNGLMRKPTQDIELNGFIVPKGWRIYTYTRETNHDPFIYPEPLTFNPWRWLDKSLESNNYMMLFGTGSRLCPGKELALAEISTFLHYIVTRYSWEILEGYKLVDFPRVQAPNGLRIRVRKYESFAV